MSWCRGAAGLTVHVVPFAEIQEEIRRSCPEDHFTLIMRRFMMRLADALAHELGCGALVTGECLGQVASQTMGALAVSEDAATLPVLRPLIGMDKEEIVRIARHIGTFDTSILPYEDCLHGVHPPSPQDEAPCGGGPGDGAGAGRGGSGPAGHGEPGHREDQVREGGFC